MAVVKNLMIRIGADYSAARKGMHGATQELTKFRRDTTKTTAVIRGRNGYGGIAYDLKNLGSTVTSSLSRIRGAKGIGGVVSELGNLRPALGAASNGFRGLGASAGVAGSALGATTLALGVFTAALAIATIAIYKASQPAVKFEADLGRLQMQLKGNTREFMQWSRSMGLSKSTASELGATYGTLLSSFIRDNNSLTNATKQIVQTTRVVASATGRTIEDTTERIRSGLLGNTEAIEDLGIFVNVSMIESTAAFKKFANGKHWNQLDFQVQQQIRLAAILEQAYTRYGDKLQNNVMTKQTLLMEQLKDIKLNLSQAFLPIWDAILPALAEMARSLAYTTEQLARFTYWLRGWNYDERTQGLNQQTDAVQEQGNAYNELADQAKSARKELAAFDQLNLLGDSNGGSGSGSGGGSFGSPPGGGLDVGDPWKGIPPYPPFLNKKYRIEFDRPNPPDAGIGGVATAVVTTVNRMIAETKAKLAQMWADLQTQTQAGILAQMQQINGFSLGLTGVMIPALVASVNIQWSQMWEDLKSTIETNAPQLKLKFQAAFDGLHPDFAKSLQNIKITWKTMLDTLLGETVIFTPLMSAEWAKVVESIKSVRNPLANIKTEWHNTLNYMQSQLNAYRPYLESAWASIGASISRLKSPLETVSAAWDTALSNMNAAVSTYMAPIKSMIDSVTTAWDTMRQKLNTALPKPPSLIPNLSASPSPSNSTSPDPISIEGFKSYFQNMFSTENFNRIWDTFKVEAEKQENQTALGVLSTFVSGGGLAKGASALFKQFPNLFKGIGNAIPAFATGGLVYGPTLAMVGDNPGAATDPEVIAPASMLEDYFGNDGNDAEQLAVLRQILGAISSGRNVQVTVSRNEVGQAAVDYINSETRRGMRPIQSP